MKNFILMLMLCLSASLVNAQKKDTTHKSTTYLDSDGNYKSKASKGISNLTAKNTGKFFITAKGEKYPVYESVNGKLYILRVSAKSGNEYKQYLKL